MTKTMIETVDGFIQQVKSITIQHTPREPIIVIKTNESQQTHVEISIWVEETSDGRNGTAYGKGASEAQTNQALLSAFCHACADLQTNLQNENLKGGSQGIKPKIDIGDTLTLADLKLNL